MKIRYFLLLACCWPLTVQAQNKIIVIKNDGTQEKVIVNQPPQSSPQSEEKTSQSSPSNIPSAADLLKQEQVIDLPQVKQQPEPKITAKDKKIAPVPKKKLKPIKTQKQVRPVSKTPPPPKPKPNEAEIERAKAAKPLINHIDPSNIPAGTPITRDLATRAALEVAPPSRGFEVFETQFNDRSAYQIRFKTENGPHDVIIDAQDGSVLKK